MSSLPGWPDLILPDPARPLAPVECDEEEFVGAAGLEHGEAVHGSTPEDAVAAPTIPRHDLAPAHATVARGLIAALSILLRHESSP